MRAVVEQTIGDLKTAKVLNANKIGTVGMMEKVLDCVIGLHNLRVLLKMNPLFDIPERRRAVLNEHVFSPLVRKSDVDLHIPKDPPDLTLSKLKHIREFIEFLPCVAPRMEDALERGGKECVFFPTVRKQGENLHAGAYVMQLQVQKEVMDVWAVRYCVGASYSFEHHVGYVQMTRENAVVASICDCYAG